MEIEISSDAPRMTKLAHQHTGTKLKYFSTCSLRPHELVAEDLINYELKASYTRSLRPHTLVAQSL
jgi:hypothetical protein